MRGQAHTLEAFAAAVLVLTGVAFALQATAVTPLSASTSNQHIENQEEATAEGLLAATEANGTLAPAVFEVTNSSIRSQGLAYHDGGPPNDFGAALNETFNASRIAYNVEIRYPVPSGKGFNSVWMVYMGTPSDNAVTATRVLTFFDDTRLPGTTKNVSTAFVGTPAEDIDPDGELYTIAEVRIVVWRI